MLRRAVSDAELERLQARRLRVAVGYSAWSETARRWHQGLVERGRALGWDVRAVCVTPAAPARALTWPELADRQRRRDPSLVRVRESLRAALADADIFWLFNGANVHPAWLAGFDTLNVYSCFDDPESSDALSRPVARYFDAALVGNLSCLPLYQSWGVRRLAWMPLGFIGDDFDPALTPEQVLTEDRPLGALFLGERETPWRRRRLDRLVQAFPDAVFRGRGWPQGPVDATTCRALYRQARIGWNIHNGPGPVNLRVFALLAAGVLQLCDNRCRVGQVFRLGEELVGFDSIDECIELTRYYLEHEDERRRIAANGLRRYRADFTEARLWEHAMLHLAEWLDDKRAGRCDTPRWEPPPDPLPTPTAKLRYHANRVLRRLGLTLERAQPVAAPPPTLSPADAMLDPPPPYQERLETGAVNFEEKRKRLAQGGWMEWPNMVALNWAVATLVGPARRIVELGGGTGCFAYEAAAEPTRHIVCAELDGDALAWARQHRARPNIEYVQRLVTPADGPFDLVVAVEVIEHLADYAGFLRLCADLAPRALLSTPNRARDPGSDTPGPPAYHQHVREWTAGEFYWVLRAFYRRVNLYALADPCVPSVVPIQVTDRRTPLIAECHDPLR